MPSYPRVVGGRSGVHFLGLLSAGHPFGGSGSGSGGGGGDGGAAASSSKSCAVQSVIHGWAEWQMGFPQVPSRFEGEEGTGGVLT